MDVPTTVILASLLGVMLPAQLTHADEYSWQMKQLFNPGKIRLQAENQDKILIYQGLKDTDVNRAMDDQYKRIEYMMFINVIVTDSEGQPLSDPATGEIIVEDDGC